MGSKSDFPKSCKNQLGGPPKITLAKWCGLSGCMCMCLPVAVQRDATPKALCIHTPPSANHVKISTRSANQAGFGSKGGENVPRMPVSRQKMQGHFWTPQGHFWTLPSPRVGEAVRVKIRISPKSSKNQLRGPQRKPPTQWHGVSGRHGRMAHVCAFTPSWVICARFASTTTQTLLLFFFVGVWHELTLLNRR